MPNISRKRHQLKLITQKVEDWEFVDLTKHLNIEDPEQLRLFHDLLKKYKP